MDQILQPPGTVNGNLESLMRDLIDTIDPDPAEPSPWTDGDRDFNLWGTWGRGLRPRPEVEYVIANYLAPRRAFLFNQDPATRPRLPRNTGQPIPDSPRSTCLAWWSSMASISFRFRQPGRRIPDPAQHHRPGRRYLRLDPRRRHRPHLRGRHRHPRRQRHPASQYQGTPARGQGCLRLPRPHHGSHRRPAPVRPGQLPGPTLGSRRDRDLARRHRHDHRLGHLRGHANPMAGMAAHCRDPLSSRPAQSAEVGALPGVSPPAISSSSSLSTSGW
jgi:hypothetical protein